MVLIDKIKQRVDETRSFLCIGLDPDILILQRYGFAHNIFEFNKHLIDVTHKYTVAYKPQFAHYAALSQERALEKTIHYIKKEYPNIPVILDSKRGDIGSTAEKYAIELYERYQVDGATLNPYMGLDTLEPYYAYQDKVNIILIKTSNKGSQDFQNLRVHKHEELYMYIAEKVVEKFGCEKTMFVVGATCTDELLKLRQRFPSITFLVPGIGAQEGDLTSVIKAGISKTGHGLLLNVSRGVTLTNSQDICFDQYLQIVDDNAYNWYKKIKVLRENVIEI